VLVEKMKVKSCVAYRRKHVIKENSGVRTSIVFILHGNVMEITTAWMGPTNMQIVLTQLVNQSSSNVRIINASRTRGNVMEMMTVMITRMRRIVQAQVQVVFLMGKFAWLGSLLAHLVNASKMAKFVIGYMIARIEVMNRRSASSTNAS